VRWPAAIRWLFSKDNDAIRVCAFGIILDTPAIRRLCKFLIVDEDKDRTNLA